MSITQAQASEISQAITRGLKTLEKPEPLRLSEWADKHFYLSAESSYVEGRWETLHYQRAVMDCISNDDIRELSFIKSARVGFALAIDTPLPTPTGWVTMGEVKPGDMLFNEQGKLCRVEYKSPVYTDHQCYRIRFCDESEIIADGGHQWLVESDFSIEYLTGSRGNGRIGRPKPGDKATKIGVVSTETMAKAIHTPRGRTAIAIRNAGALELPDADLPIPPYTLGLWLGDGHLVTPRITQHRPDTETAEYIREEGINAEVRYIDARYPNNATIFLNIPKNGRPISSLCPTFRDLGLLDKKYIPEIYLRASCRQRLSLLQGLMDSDGTIGVNGRAEFTNTNEKLAQGVYELVVSLGMNVALRMRPPPRNSILPQYRVNFKAIPEANPFRLRRKADRVLRPDKPTITYRRRVVAIDLVESVPVQCIQVDSKSNLFLAGKQMIPTHNTKIILAAMAYHAEHKRRNQAVWQPVDDDAVSFCKTEIDPMLRDVPVVRSVFPWYEKKSKHNTLYQKTFLGSMLHIRGGKAAKNYRRISVDVAYLDELDGFDREIESEGDAVTLASKRVEGSTFPKVILGSTPKTKNESLIEFRAEQAELFFRFYIPCPHCHHQQTLKWGGKDCEFGLKWTDNAPETAAYLCEDCGALFTQTDYLDVWHQGRWQTNEGIYIDPDGIFRDSNDDITHTPLSVAFHIWTAYSPMTSWPQIAREFLAARKDRSKLKTFVNTTLGESWEEDEGEKIEHTSLFYRREHYPARVPDGAVILTAGIDTQDDRFELQVDGWGAGEERWTIDYIRLYGDPSRQLIWDKLLEILGKSYLRAGGGLMNIRLVCQDHGGHYSDEVNGFSKRAGVRFLIPTKGSSIYGRPVATFPRKRNDKGVYLTAIGTDTAKDLLYQRLLIQQPGPGYWHWPVLEAFDEEYFKQLTNEKRSPKFIKGRRTYVWDANGRRQEPWDCSVLSLAAVRILQQHFGLNLEAHKAITGPVPKIKSKQLKRIKSSFL